MNLVNIGLYTWYEFENDNFKITPPSPMAPWITLEKAHHQDHILSMSMV